MMWRFEWNWLGYSWAVLVGGMLLVMAVRIVREMVWVVKIGRLPLDHDPLMSPLYRGALSVSVFLGALSIWVWDFETAGRLVAASWMIVSSLGGIYLAMRQLVHWKNRRAHRAEDADILTRFDQVVARQDDKDGEADLQECIDHFGPELRRALENRVLDDPAFRDTFQHAHTELIVFLTDLDRMTSREFEVIAAHLLAKAVADPRLIHTMRHHHLTNPSGVAAIIFAQLQDEDSLHRYANRRYRFQKQYRERFPEDEAAKVTR